MWDPSSNLGLEILISQFAKKRSFCCTDWLGPPTLKKNPRVGPTEKIPYGTWVGFEQFPHCPIGSLDPEVVSAATMNITQWYAVRKHGTWAFWKGPSFPLSNVVLETTRSPIPYLCEHEGISFTRSPFWTWLRRIDAADFGQSPFGFDHCHLHRHVRELKKPAGKFLGFRLHVEGWWILLRFGDTIGDGLDWRRHTKWDKKREKSFVWSVVSCKGGCAILRITLRGARRLAGNHGLIVWYNNDYCNYGGGCWTFFSNDWWLSI